ncbi:MAG: DUF4316 domain-containing protein [Oscillospiraceae bacterium]|nr:DUF4316 domain-containing protein [Oscillospiraceae bacterium]
MKKEKQNYLASAEMDEEGNYNMIDGIINNILINNIPKPSLLEQMKEYERRIAENKNNALNIETKKQQICHLEKEEL